MTDLINDRKEGPGQADSGDRENGSRELIREKWDRIRERLEGITGVGTVLEQESMALHTTFRAGGAARLYVSKFDTMDCLCEVLRFLESEKIPHTVIGKGSNLLVSDSGYEGVIVDLSGTLTEIRTEGTRVIAQAGVSLASLAREALNHSLTGMEFAAGIPGCVGGAVVMNAGAYGGEMKDILRSVKVFEGGMIRTFSAEELKLGYRSSIFTENEGSRTVLEAEFDLSPGDPEEIRSLMEDLAKRRRDKQPLNYPSAGSTFKRPEGDFAGRLIQAAGLSGFRVGGAMVSEKHCGFVINYDHATATELYELFRQVRKRVLETSGRELELEVRLLGKFE